MSQIASILQRCWCIALGVRGGVESSEEFTSKRILLPAGTMIGLVLAGSNADSGDPPTAIVAVHVGKMPSTIGLAIQLE